MALYQPNIISFSLFIMVASILLPIITLDVAANPASTVGKNPDDNCKGSAKLKLSSHNGGLADIAKSTIQATIKKITEAKAITAKMMASKAKDKKTHSSLEVCQESYHDAIVNLEASIKHMETGSHAELMDKLSAAMTAYSTCDDVFVEMTGEKSPLADLNFILSKLTSNSLALGEKI